MVNEEKNFRRFREMIIAQQKNGQTGFLIWKSPEEREAMGGDEKEMKVNGAFLPHGIRSDGRFYGEYRESMELDRAIRGAVLIKGQFNLNKKDGIIAMLFIVENLLANEGHLKFACRMMEYGHLNGPIISYPAYEIVEIEGFEKIVK